MFGEEALESHHPEEEGKRVVVDVAVGLFRTGEARGHLVQHTYTQDRRLSGSARMDADLKM